MRFGSTLGRAEVQHKLQHLQQHQACASSACKAGVMAPKEALQRRLAAAHVRPQQIWLQGVCLATRGHLPATRRASVLLANPSASRVETRQDMGMQAARSNQDSADRWACRPNGLSTCHLTWALQRADSLQYPRCCCRLVACVHGGLWPSCTLERTHMAGRLCEHV